MGGSGEGLEAGAVIQPPPNPSSACQPGHVGSAGGGVLGAPAREESCSVSEKHTGLLPRRCHSQALPPPAPAQLQRARVPPCTLAPGSGLPFCPRQAFSPHVQRDLACLAVFNSGLDSSLSRSRIFACMGICWYHQQQPRNTRCPTTGARAGLVFMSLPSSMSWSRARRDNRGSWLGCGAKSCPCLCA